MALINYTTKQHTTSDGRQLEFRFMEKEYRDERGDLVQLEFDWEIEDLTPQDGTV